MSERTPDSDRPPDGPPSTGPGAVRAVADMRHRLAIVQHERRQAIFDAREAHGDRPSALPEVHEAEKYRGKLPSVDELVASGRPGRAARWRLVVALGGALLAFAEVARELVLLVKH